MHYGSTRSLGLRFLQRLPRLHASKACLNFRGGERLRDCLLARRGLSTAAVAAENGLNLSCSRLLSAFLLLCCLLTLSSSSPSSPTRAGAAAFFPRWRLLRPCLGLLTSLRLCSRNLLSERLATLCLDIIWRRRLNVLRSRRSCWVNLVFKIRTCRGSCSLVNVLLLSSTLLNQFACAHPTEASLDCDSGLSLHLCLGVSLSRSKCFGSLNLLLLGTALLHRFACAHSAKAGLDCDGGLGLHLCLGLGFHGIQLGPPPKFSTLHAPIRGLNFDGCRLRLCGGGGGGRLSCRLLFRRHPGCRLLLRGRVGCSLFCCCHLGCLGRPPRCFICCRPLRHLASLGLG
mmetsp:Transcript_2933/g.8848  ORF Transcript_2933/g.8848 Transcript_2933/m.8848 type:complete len:343 (+) Transcript_2933:948-1976(+)